MSEQPTGEYLKNSIEEPKNLDEALLKIRELKENFSNLKIKFYGTVKWMSILSALALGITQGINSKISSDKKDEIGSKLDALSGMIAKYQINADGLYYNSDPRTGQIEGSKDYYPSESEFRGWHNENDELSNQIDSTLNSIANDIGQPQIY